jgi:hypothetical protein
MRLRSDGTLDPSFSGDGVALLDADGVDNYAYALATDAGKLVLGLHMAENTAGFARLSADGARDETFGEDGVVSHGLSVGWEVRDVAVLPDHRLVGVNGRASGPNIVALRPRGGLDASYSADGEGVGPLTGASGEGLVLLGNGKVVVAGDLEGDVIATRLLAP